MAVTVEMVRTQIGDRPQVYPPSSDEPEIIGVGDGTATIFALQFENYIPGTLTIYESPAPTPSQPPVFTAVASNQYTVGAPAPGPDQTNATNATITFNSAPAAGTLIAARSQSTAFSDADLTMYLNNAIAASYPDDRTTLKAVNYDLIPAIKMDQRRLMILSRGTYREDPSAFLRGLDTLSAQLFKDLEGGPLPGEAIAAFATVNNAAPRYTPSR